MALLLTKLRINCLTFCVLHNCADALSSIHHCGLFFREPDCDASYGAAEKAPNDGVGDYYCCCLHCYCGSDFAFSWLP